MCCFEVYEHHIYHDGHEDSGFFGRNSNESLTNRDRELRCTGDNANAFCCIGREYFAHLEPSRNLSLSGRSVFDDNIPDI